MARSRGLHIHVREPLPFAPDIGHRARQVVRERVLAAIDPQIADDLELVITELVTNAFRHGQEPIELHISVIGGDVRVEVLDGSRRLPGEPLPIESGHYGLLAISRVSDAWGADPTPAGKRVWSRLSSRSQAGDPGAR